MTDIQTQPYVVVVTQESDIKLTLNATSWLQSGESVGSPAVTAEKLPNHESASSILPSSPTGSSPYITQRFSGFQRGQSYLVKWKFTTTSQPLLVVTTVLKCEA
jgi:hypothetical protein